MITEKIIIPAIMCLLLAAGCATRRGAGNGPIFPEPESRGRNTAQAAPVGAPEPKVASKQDAAPAVENNVVAAAQKPGVVPVSEKPTNIIVDKKLVDKDKTVHVYRVTYQSAGLKVRGLMFENQTKGRTLPGVVFNHGGVDGIPEAFKNRCRELAAEGYHVFAPSYRGEDGSEGKVEVAAGEVDDAINGARVLQQWPGVDASRIAMAGASHGGIITLLAAQRMDMRAAVSFYGVANTYTWYQFLIDYGHDVTDPLSRQVYGYGPKDKPEAFRSRAPALDAALTRAPVLLVYGDSDTIVPPSQGREMAGSLAKAGKTYELKIVRGAGHGFIFRNSKKSSARDRARAAEGWNAMLAFLKKYL